MLSFLKQHPFAVEAFFERSIVLGFALPLERLEPLVPTGLSLDSFEDLWGFLAVAMVRTRDLRPAGWPRWLGRAFSLVGYRIFVRYRTSEGKNLRGLYILRTETDRLGMQLSGNLFTRYDYRSTDLTWDVEAEQIGLRSRRSELDVRVTRSSVEPGLPESSPFRDWPEARRFAGPMPHTFSLGRRQNEMVIIKGVRTNWNPRPLVVNRAEVGFLKRLGLGDAYLANAFMVSDIPYLWERGRIDPMSPEDGS
jgi:hypothetical protein